MVSRNKRDAFFSSGAPSKDILDDSPPVTSSYIRSRNTDLSYSKYDTNGYSTSNISLLTNTSALSSADVPETDNLVGFSSLLNQIQRNALRRGFDFNLMVVGASGLGKSTFINSLFLSEVYNPNYLGPSKRPNKTHTPEAIRYLLKENGVQLRLTIIDTPGFGDLVDNSNCWKPIIDYVESKFSEHMRNEQRVHRPLDARDQRVHACLYFVEPTGHGLKQLDIEFMRQIHEKVNIIPIIGKADSLTPDECQAFKKTIYNELLQQKIVTYDFPEEIISLTGGEPEQVKSKKLRERQPFAVIGSNCLIPSTTGGRGARGRTYPWGTVEVDNLDHNDFVALRTLLLNVHMKDLIESTERIHYEKYRQQRLSQIAEQGNFAKDPLAQLEEEQATFEARMRKSEAEMEQVFEQKVREKLAKLKELELTNQRRADQMQKQLQNEELELEERWKAFNIERQSWENNSLGTSDSPQGSQATLPTNIEKPKDKKKKGTFFS